MFLFEDEKDPTKLFQEANNKPNIGDIIKGSVKGATNIDVDETKQSWKNGNKVKTVNDTAKKLGDAADKYDTKMKSLQKDSKSIIARARKSTMQFPVYISQTCQVNLAQIVTDLFERVYTDFVKTTISQDPILSEEEANNLVFLNKYHTNIKESVETFFNEFYEPIDEMDSIIKDSMYCEERISENCTMTLRAVKPIDLIHLESIRFANDPLTGFTTFFGEASEVRKETKTKWSKMEDSSWRNMAIDKLDDKTKKYFDDDFKPSSPEERAEKEEAEKKLKNIIKEIQSDVKAEASKDNKDKKYPNLTYKNGQFARGDNEGGTITINKPVDTPKMLRDTDIKKLNSMQPWQFEVSFRIRDKKGVSDRDVKYILGVKCILHLIRVQDLADDLQELVTGKIKSLQKVRYKTGEIGFMDYLFNLKGLKADASKNINHNKRWINTLKRLSEFKAGHGGFLRKPVEMFTGSNNPIPNGTLVLTQSDVTTLIDQTGIDLSDGSNAVKLGKNLFLMAVAIIDGSAGTIRTLFVDNGDSWQVNSIASLDSELSKADNSQIMRELNKMVNK